MKTAITAPRYASSDTPANIRSTAQKSTEAESTASESASAPEACSDAEPTASPFFPTYRPRISLVMTARAISASAMREYSAGRGENIFFTDSASAVTPAYSTRNATSVALRYSILP